MRPARRLLSLAATALLAACAFSAPPVPSSGSAAFRLAAAIQNGERGDLPAAARAAGLVETGVCREVGSGRFYCNALQVPRFGGQSTIGYGPFFGFEHSLYYEELRMCLAPGRAVGFVARYRSGHIPAPLLREYSEELAPLLRSSGIEVLEGATFAESTILEAETSLTDLPVNAAVRRLGYGGRGSRYELSEATGLYTSWDYPPHGLGEQACARL